MGRRKNEAAWKRLRELPLGTKVVVSAQMEDVGEGPGTHRWVAEPCEPFEAWVCGAKWLCDGTVETESYGGGGYEYPEDPYDVTSLVVTKKTPVLLVRRAMFGRAIPVPVDGVERWFSELASLGHPPLMTPAPSWDDRAKAVLREDMKSVPRDARGRWMKIQVHERHPEST